MFGAVSILLCKLVTLMKLFSALVASGPPALLLVFVAYPNSIIHCSFGTFKSKLQKIPRYTKVIATEEDLYFVEYIEKI